MNTRGHLSSETIDLLLLAALSANESNQAKQHIDECSECRVRWRELNEDKQRFEQFVFARTLPKVEARILAERESFFDRFKLKWLLPALALSAAAVVGVVLLKPAPTEDPYVGIKGQPTFEVFAVRGTGGAFPVRPETALQPADRIRFVVNPAGARHLLVASTDGAGTFSVYHPFGAERSEPVDAQRKVELPGAVELDDTLGSERLVAAFSQEPIDARQVEAALKVDAKNPKLPGVSFVIREFRKVAP